MIQKIHIIGNYSGLKVVCPLVTVHPPVHPLQLLRLLFSPANTSTPPLPQDSCNSFSFGLGSSPGRECPPSFLLIYLFCLCKYHIETAPLPKPAFPYFLVQLHFPSLYTTYHRAFICLLSPTTKCHPGRSLFDDCSISRK